MKISIKISENLISRIYSGPQVFGEINKFLWNFCGKPSGVYLLVDENTHRFCLPKLLNEVPCLEKAEIIVTPSGEQNKDIRHVVQIWGKLMKMGAIRHSLLVNLGGGMITDLGGFAAATFKRGIPFIHIPTTLMGMTDAAIGGKTGVNIDLVKNQAGVYSNPEAVFIHPGFLETLKPDQMMSGLAEMIKYALILDAPLWKKLLKMDFRTLRDLQKEDPQWDDLICRLVKMKARVVSADYRENKYRRILNFGHTAGHALESFSISDGNKKLTHGHAVAMGMIVESWISCRETGMDSKYLEEIKKMILDNYSYYPLEKRDIPELIELMKHDKKNLDEKINFTLITEPGKAIIDQPCEVEMVEEALEYYIHVAG